MRRKRLGRIFVDAVEFSKEEEEKEEQNVGEEEKEERKF